MSSSAWSSDVCSRSEEHTSELQSHDNLVCRLLLEQNNRLHVDPMNGGFGAGRHPARVVRHHLPIGRRGDRNHGGGRFFFNDTAPTEIYPLSPHDALPI